MSLRASDGMRTAAGASCTVDITIQTLDSGNSVNGASHDMREHFEFIAVAIIGTITGTTTVRIQESDDNSTFTNISAAFENFASADDDTCHAFAVDWKNPARKRYARIQASHTGGGNSVLAACGLRISAHEGDLDDDDNVDQA